MSRKLRLSLTIAAAAAPLGSVAFGQAPLFAGNQIKVGENPQNALSMDLNSDGLLDLVTANAGGTQAGEIAWRYGAGAAGFVPGSSVAVSHPGALGLGDMNNDGGLDCVSSYSISSTNRGLTIVFNSGTGIFLAGPLFNYVLDVRALAITDWNLDGNLDVMTANNLAGSVTWMAGTGGGQLGSATVLAAQGFPSGIVVSDLNVDGAPDIAVSGAASNALLLMFGNAQGGILSQKTVGTSPSSSTLTVGDVNNDGLPDMAAGGVTGKIDILVNTGNGNFTFGGSYTTATNVAAIALADFNNNGAVDFVAATATSPGLFLGFGNGAGGFTPPKSFYNSGTASGLVAADFTGDGFIDIVTNHTPNLQTVLVNDGFGGFVAPAQLASTAQFAFARVADFNGDGHGDIAASDTNIGAIRIFLGNGAGGYLAMPNVPVSGYAIAFTTDDLTQDGIPDLAIVNYTSGELWVYIGDGKGKFGNGIGGSTAAFKYINNSFRFFDMAAGDLNGDFIPDLVFTGQNNNNLMALLNNGNGTFTPQPIVNGAQLVERVALGDANNDGFLDAALATSFFQSIRLHAGLGNGSFGAPTFASTQLVGVRTVILRDVTNDGLPDLTMSANDAFAPGNVEVRKGVGGSQFNALQSLSTYSTNVDVACADFDFDGNVDLAVSNLVASHGVIEVFLNNGAPTFTSSGLYMGGDMASKIGIGELNDDNFPDIAIGGTGITLLTSTKPVVPGIQTFGFGTPGCYGAHPLTSGTAPHLGNANFTLTSKNAAPLSLGLGLVGNAPSVSPIDYLFVGIGFHVNPLASTELFAFDAVCDATGTSNTFIPIPNNPFLIGSKYYAQTFFVTQTGTCVPSPFGLSSSNGLEITILP